MTDTRNDSVVPLPAHLLECGCPMAHHGAHLTSCVPARQYDAMPLSEHPQYALGQRFQAIRWQYPMRISVRVAVEVEIDPLAFIAAHRAGYETYVLDRGYAEWEKPMQFLSEKISQECDVASGMSFGHPRHVSHASSDIVDWSESPYWTAEMTADLHARLAEMAAAPVVDPNQISLLGDEP